MLSRPKRVMYLTHKTKEISSTTFYMMWAAIIVEAVCFTMLVVRLLL